MPDITPVLQQAVGNVDAGAGLSQALPAPDLSNVIRFDSAMNTPTNSLPPLVTFEATTRITPDPNIDALLGISNAANQRSAGSDSWLSRMLGELQVTTDSWRNTAQRISSNASDGSMASGIEGARTTADGDNGIVPARDSEAIPQLQSGRATLDPELDQFAQSARLRSVEVLQTVERLTAWSITHRFAVTKLNMIQGMVSSMTTSFNTLLKNT